MLIKAILRFPRSMSDNLWASTKKAHGASNEIQSCSHFSSIWCKCRKLCVRLPMLRRSKRSFVPKRHGYAADLRADHLPHSAPIDCASADAWDSPIRHDQLPATAGIQSLYQAIQLADGVPMKPFALVLASLLMADLTWALTPQDASNEIAGEFAECAGYYSIGMILLENSGKPEEAKSQQIRIDRALHYASQFSTFPKALAGYQMSAQQQAKILKVDGFSKLIYLYNDKCKDMLEQPSNRLQYWLDQK